MPEFCSYYGSYRGKLKTSYDVGLNMVDEAYQRILDKHEEKLIKCQKKIICELRKAFVSDIRKMNDQFRIISNRLRDIESNLKKDEEDATQEGKVKSSSKRKHQGNGEVWTSTEASSGSGTI